MKGGPARVAAASLAVLSLAACAGPSDSQPMAVVTASTIPFTMQPDFPRDGGLEGFGVEHIALDTGGAYVCVLRRGDDLATLRGRFNPRP